MEPKCLFAIFAEQHKYTKFGLNLMNIYTMLNFGPLPPDLRGRPAFITKSMTLYAFVLADEGHHTLSFAFNPKNAEPIMISKEFEIKPEHKNGFLVAFRGDFPIRIRYELNEYPLLLDGLPLATAYLVSNPSYDVT